MTNRQGLLEFLTVIIVVIVIILVVMFFTSFNASDNNNSEFLLPSPIISTSIVAIPLSPLFELNPLIDLRTWLINSIAELNIERTSLLEDISILLLEKKLLEK